MKIEKKYWPWIGLSISIIAVSIWQQRRIVRYAKGFLGITEIGDNMGWDDPGFEKKLKGVGWYKGAQWCVYYVKALYADIYPSLKTKTYKGKKLIDYITGNSQSSYNGLKTLEKETGFFKFSGTPRAGDIVIWQYYDSSGNPTNKGHMGVVSLVIGDRFRTVEGNTSEIGNVEETVAKKKHDLGEYLKKKGLRLKGFVRYISN